MPPSMTAVLLENLSRFQLLSQTLFHSLSPEIKAPPPSIQDFLQADAELATAVRLANVHQTKQRKIKTLKQEVSLLEESWRTMCEQLEMEKSGLETLMEECEERVQAIDSAKRASIPYPELLAYAHSLSAFTSAPPNMPDLTLPGQPPPPLFYPPFPNEEKMRRGRLNAEAPLGVPGETHSIGTILDPSPSAVRTTRPVAPSLYRNDSGLQQQFLDFDLDLNPDL